uniref:SP-RING-type domain-containing protein n=1 Tax=Aureoumbra lagunensis TaxID=44058 RepID=A0A7S3NP00_9STRA|mmetsp:Transcript_20833/g.26986  ORF Transcript_20833/g.26986 Transcript_20833/m.26986 type:complete len:282 (+) Transcript_20833:61-906(+)|eukprot:CAMPEP_0197286416 /NCGR_PEP_ID=MMETSP0890-20130614/1831_1 /TAXON_ID=44058 ORGANISM="Aureoumbra lagunensis, Strain CCMP1510" /NCGR_SAMPLE_ID=MMETSP0890 /ASSEMBLY_ACC=CAM_ASM_000533 /LENGTH=281 /DNA_ID=CAMNT_0042754713 /DNA_START=60 /DNA_END=905 /DNA_ORIENTATION=+
MPRRAPRGGRQRTSGETENDGPSNSGGAIGAIDRVTGKSDQYHEDGIKLRASLHDFGKLLGSIAYLDDDKRKEMSEQLLGVMKTSLETKQEIDIFVEAVKSIKPKLSATTSLDDLTNNLQEEEIPDIDALISEQVDRSKRNASSVENDNDYQKFLKALKLNKNQDDDEIEIDETQHVSEAQLRDPITQTLFDKPQKSKKCRHVYSLLSVNSYFSKTKKCAYAGCHHVLSKSDFTRDPDTEILLRKFERLTQRQATQNETDELDIDEDDDDAMEVDDDDDDE